MNENELINLTTEIRNTLQERFEQVLVARNLAGESSFSLFIANRIVQSSLEGTLAPIVQMFKNTEVSERQLRFSVENELTLRIAKDLQSHAAYTQIACIAVFLGGILSAVVPNKRFSFPGVDMSISGGALVATVSFLGGIACHFQLNALTIVKNFVTGQAAHLIAERQVISRETAEEETGPRQRRAHR